MRTFASPIIGRQRPSGLGFRGQGCIDWKKRYMDIHWRFAKNVVANLGRRSAAAVVALLLPPVLVRHMTPPSYAVWVLVLQVAAYASYLSFGLQEFPVA
jgi:hypothetical protein